MVGLIVELTAKLLLSQLAESRYCISNVTGLDGTLRRCHKVGTLKRSVAAPMGRQLVYRRRVDGRQSVLVYGDVLARQAYLNLAWLVGVGGIEHNVALFFLGLFRIIC